ncbi:MAG: FHA domain-containing protein [bacterium]
MDMRIAPGTPAHPQPLELATMLEDLEAFRELRQRLDRYTRLLENTERHRDTVRPGIYQKVRSEYAARQQELQGQEDRDGSDLGERAQRFLRQHGDLRAAARENRDSIDEIEFRVRVGEFSEEEVADELQSLEQTLQETTTSIRSLGEVLGVCTQLDLLPERTPDSRETEADAGDPDEDLAADPEPESFFRSEQIEESEDSRGPVSCEPAVNAPEGPGDGSVEKSSPRMSAATQADFLVVEEEDVESSSTQIPVIECPESLSCGSSLEGPGDGGDASPGDALVCGYLCALEGSRKGTRFPLISSDITMGKSPGIDIRLMDTGIANFHARVVYKGRKHYLENLDPMGRSFVNGIQADLVELKDGDLIRLGEIKMRVEFAPSHATELASPQAA